MSWDADLLCDTCRSELGGWNYTHNTSTMIYKALAAAGVERDGNEPWWLRLDGMSARDGAAYLSTIIAELEADPVGYTAMSPANGWGNYRGLLGELRAMRDKSIDTSGDATWDVSG